MKARIRPRNLAAKALRTESALRHRVVRDRTRYSRKIKHRRIDTRS